MLFTLSYTLISHHGGEILRPQDTIYLNVMQKVVVKTMYTVCQF